MSESIIPPPTEADLAIDLDAEWRRLKTIWGTQSEDQVQAYAYLRLLAASRAKATSLACRIAVFASECDNLRNWCVTFWSAASPGVESLVTLLAFEASLVERAGGNPFGNDAPKESL